MFSRILWMALFLILSCKGPSDQGHIFSVSKIETGKDGKTLFLKDSNGTVYTTVISIPNRNYAEVHVGDKVRLEINEILVDMEPIVILARSVEPLK